MNTVRVPLNFKFWPEINQGTQFRRVFGRFGFSKGSLVPPEDGSKGGSNGVVPSLEGYLGTLRDTKGLPLKHQEENEGLPNRKLGSTGYGIS